MATVEILKGNNSTNARREHLAYTRLELSTVDETGGVMGRGPSIASLGVFTLFKVLKGEVLVGVSSVASYSLSLIEVMSENESRESRFSTISWLI